MSIGEKLKEIRNSRGLTQIQLSQMANISRSYLGDIEGDRYNPSVETLKSLANALSVDVSVFFAARETGFSPKAMRIPVLGRIPAGIPIEAIEDILDWEEVPIGWARGGKTYFALKIKGDSMMPKYLDEDVIIVERQDSVDTGQDAVVIINGHDATFKKVLLADDGITLQPLNPHYEPSHFSNDDILRLPIRIIGVCREIRRKP